MIRLLRARGLLVAPSWGAFLLIFVAPLVYFFVVSFWRVSAFKLRPDASLANYIQVVTDYNASILFTFLVALTIAVLVTVVAFGFSFYIRFKVGRFGDTLLFIVLITLFGGYLTKIYVWKTILGENGVLNSALLSLGLIRDPITVFLYNPAAVVITLGHYTLPLAILPIYGALRGVEDTPLRCAQDLGASHWRVVRDIILPQCRVGILFAFTLTYLFAAGDYVTPQLIGGPYTSMIGVLIQLQFGFRFNAPLGSALAFTMIAIALLTVGIVAFALRKWLRPRG
jgi:spermidine/putrescine transport system permease protein